LEIERHGRMILMFIKIVWIKIKIQLLMYKKVLLEVLEEKMK